MQCTSPAADEQWKWHQWFLYQAQNQTAFRRCSPSHWCRSLVPVPAASWLIHELDTTIVATVKSFTLALIGDQNEALLPVWWDHTAAESSLSNLSCQCNSFLTSCVQHLSYDARWANSLVAFFTECFVNQCCRYVRWGPAVEGTPDSSLFGHWYSTLSSLA